MEQISGADLLAIRSQAAMADDYTTICRNNIDRLSQAYLSLQVENVRLRKLVEDAIVAMVDDGWLFHGPEGMSEAQKKCHEAYLTIKTPNV